LARALAARTGAEFFDLESPPDRARLSEPMLALRDLKGMVVLDEIQQMPELLPVLRVLADRDPLAVRFLLLGSASPDLVRGSSETLAGRIEFVELDGFDLAEVGARRLDQLWIRGGFPRSLLAASEADSVAWRSNFVRTFLERDIPRAGLSLPAEQVRRLWTMLAHYHGQTLNLSEIGRSLGVSDNSIRRYIDVLSGTFMVRQLAPWHENLSKRQVKSPKVYIRDSGLLHTLLSLSDRHAVMGHPKLGASWEGFALEQVLRFTDARNAYFWGTHGGAELDLLIMSEGRRIGFEAKWTDAPRSTRSMMTALADLELDHLWVVHAGERRFPIKENITALPLSAVPDRPWE
jgi:predicted AAA+ superfamily ATPase